MVNSLEYYKVFYYVAKCGSLTVAAEKLSISQPAVSQSIKQLENSVGAKLFIRASKGVRLSKEGQLLFEHVARGYEQIKLGEEKLTRMLNLELGELRIGASDMTLEFYLLPFLEQYHEKCPGIKVRVSNGPTPETLALLQSGNIDFGVVSSPFESRANISSVAVKEIEDVFVAGRRFIQYKNRMLDLSELENLPIISLERNTSTRTNMDAYLAKNGVTIQPEFQLATSGMIIQFALRSLGVGSVMKEFAREHMESGKLFELRFNKIIPKRQFCLVTNTRNPLSVAAKNFLEQIESKG